MKKSIFMFIIIMAIFTVSCGAESTGSSAESGNDDSSGNEIVYSDPWDGTTVEQPSKENNVYIITEAKHLAWLAKQTTVTMDVRFDASVDMGNKAFTGIKEFAGTMDGNGKKIKNLNINSTSGAGLIIKMTDGKIKNLTIESGTITDDGDRDIDGSTDGVAGAFIVSVPEYATVTLEGLTNKATVNGNIAGGMIGLAFDAKITINNVGNFGTIKGSGGGGIIGEATDCTITIDNAVNSGAVTGDATGGGIIYSTTDGTITINNSENSGTIKGAVVGGIIGQTKSTTKISNTENSGAVTGNYSTDPSGGIGGIIGNVLMNYMMDATVTINNAGNSGAVTGNGTGGGIIGNVGEGSIVTIEKIYNYYIKPIIGQSYGINTINITDNSFCLKGGTITVDARSITATQFRTQSIFTAKRWDFNTVWKMGAKHPKLR